MQDLDKELEEAIKDHIYGISKYEILPQADLNTTEPAANIELLEGITIVVGISLQGYKIYRVIEKSSSELVDPKIKINFIYESLTALLKDNSNKFQDKMYDELFSKLQRLEDKEP